MDFNLACSAATDAFRYGMSVGVALSAVLLVVIFTVIRRRDP